MIRFHSGHREPNPTLHNIHAHGPRIRTSTEKRKKREAPGKLIATAESTYVEPPAHGRDEDGIPRGIDGVARGGGCGTRDNIDERRRPGRGYRPPRRRRPRHERGSVHARAPIPALILLLLCCCVVATAILSLSTY